MTCGYVWKAPLITPPGRRPEGRYIRQECKLERGHEGPHRSLANVIAPNVKREARHT